MKFRLRFGIVAGALVLSAALALAQAGRGSISGLVSDPTGAIVNGAQVTLLSQATGFTQHTVASAAGLYSFISLNPGVYQVTASQKGFASVARDKVTVSVDQVTEVNITLRVGAATETVTVTGGVDLVEPTSSTVGSLIPAEAIDRVPLLNRNVFDLVQLSAGVTPSNGVANASGSSFIENISSGRPGIDVSSYTINGAIIGSVYYMLDGSPIGVAENNSAAIMPAMEIPEDGVQEVRVETQNTPASYLSGGAGVISLVSKSGTNSFHGSMFGVFRPSVLAANEYFNKQSQLLAGQKNTAPDFHRYQEGAAIGGPIKRDKLFFFADYQATQQELFDSATFTVPTSAERTGDFSNFLNNVDSNGNPDPIVIYDPTQPEQPDGTRKPFPGNIITGPSPTALAFLSHFPKCNHPDPATCDAATDDVVPNFYVPGLDPRREHKFDVRVDWNQSARQRIFTRFSYDRLFFSGVNAFNNMWDLNYAQNVTNGRNILIADDLTLNSSTVLQLRYSFTRHHENQGGDPAQNGYDITKLGFPAALAAAEVYKTLPYINFNDVSSGIGGTANWNTFLFASENSDVNATITKVWGKHQISTGFEYMKRYLNVGQPPAPSGAYAFDVSATDQSTANGGGGSDFASFLVGMGTPPGSESYNWTRDIFAAESNPYYAFFIEDTYHPAKNLTITAGLRWDIFGGRNERSNRQEYFDPNATNTVSGVSYTGAEVYVNGGNRSPFTASLKNFGPRLGFAWQPVEHVVVRGGAGFYYGPSTHNVGNPSLNTDGFSSVTNWDATCLTANGNTVYNGATGCPTPVPGVYTVDYSLSNPFPNGVVPTLTTPPTGLGNNLGTALNTVLRSQRTPTTYNFNFGVEYELPHQVVVSAGYVGSRGLFLPLVSVDLNQLDLGTIAKYGASLCVDTSDPSCVMVPNTWAAIQPPTNSNYGEDTVPLWVSLQKYPQFGNGGYNGTAGVNGGNGINVYGYPGGDSIYHSLQTKVQKRLTGHFTTLATFTWAKLITDDGNPPLNFVGFHNGGAQDWRNLRYEHSVSPQDVKYQFTGQASYDLPVGKGQRVNLNGVSNAILGRWTINGILYLSTGVPIASPVVAAPISYFNQRPELTCNPASGAPHTAATWFNYNCFSMPASPFVAGTAPAYLDHVRTMGARDLDLSLYKTFPFGETRELRFDVSSYNVFNKAQLGMPNVPDMTSVTTQPGVAASFGQITNTLNTPRQFQFGARFTF
jgi:hypothetical protein